MKNIIRTFKFVTLINIVIFIYDYIFELIRHDISFLMFVESYSYIIFVPIATLMGVYFSYTNRETSFHFYCESNNLKIITDIIIKENYSLKSSCDSQRVFVSNNLLYRISSALEDKITVSIYDHYFLVFISKANSLTKKLEVQHNLLVSETFDDSKR